MECCYSTDPLTRLDITTINVAHYDGITLDVLLDNGGLTEDYSEQVAIYVNGVRSPEPWSTGRLLAPADSIAVYTQAHGGNTLRIVAMIALVAAATMIFGPAGPAMAAGMSGSMAAAASAGFMIAGGMLINAMLPPPVPPVPDDLTPAQQYSIAGGNNKARVGQPMMLPCGKHKVALDLAAIPYPSFENGESYYFGVYHAGLCPDAVITNLSVGETLISNYPDTVVEYSGSDGLIDLFPTNVDTNGVNVQFTDAAQTETRTTSIDTTVIAVDYTFVMYHINSKGGVSHTGVLFEFEYSPTGAGTWSPLVGGNKNVQVEGSSTTPQKKSVSVQVPKGQYDIRIKRVSGDNPGQNGTDFTWNSLRSFQPDPLTSIYENQRRIAVKYKSTNNLNGRLSAVNAEISNKTITWNGSTWTAAIETSNPAWWFLHIARGLFNAAGTKLYGGGLADSQIDLEGLKDWASFCDTNSLTFNFVFTSQMTLADALSLISRCGRATISFHTAGKLGVVYDDDQATAVWVCNPTNIVDGSFRFNYLAAKLTDGVKLNFTDAALGWKDNFVQVNLNGVQDPLQLQTIRIPGITNETMAAKEANLTLAESQFHLRTITFDMDIEGAVLHRGAIIHVTADMITWATSGRLEAGSTQTVLNLNTPIDATGTGKYILVRFPDGEMEIVEIQTGLDGDTTINLNTSLTNNPANYNPEDTVWQFEQSASPGGLFKIIDLSYSNAGKTASITAQDYDSAYYAAQNGGWQANTPNVPVYVASISGISLYEEITPKGQTRVVLLWDLTNGIGTELEIRHRPKGTVSDSSNYTNVGRLTSARYEYFTDSPEDVDFILHPVNTNGTTGTPVSFSGTVNASRGSAPAVPNVTGLEIFEQGNNQVFTGNHCKITWNRVALDTTQIGGETDNGLDEGGDDAHFKDYEVSVYNTAGDLVRTENTRNNYYTFTYEKNAESTGGNPIRAFTFKVWVRGTQNQLSNVPAKLDVSNPAPPVVTGIILDSSTTVAFIELTTPADNDYKGIGVWGSTSSGFTPGGIEQGVGNMLYKGQNDAVTISGLTPDTPMYFKIAAYDSFGLDSLNYSGEFTVTPSKITAVELADDAVGNAQLADDAVAESNLITGAVSTRVVDTDAITETEIAALAISSDQLQSNSIIAGKVAANAIGALQITANNINAGHLQTNSVEALKIKANAVTSDKINAGAVLAVKIAADQIQATHMAANSITAGNASIQNNAVITLSVAGNAITANSSSALTVKVAMFNASFGTSWSAWGNAISLVIDVGPTTSTNVDALLVLSSSFQMEVAMNGGSNSGTVQYEFRLVHSSGTPVSAIIEPTSKNYENGVGEAVSNGTGSHYLTVPSIQMAPVNTATGNVTYRLQMRTRKAVGGGAIGAAIYAPVGTNLYMGGTKR